MPDEDADAEQTSATPSPNRRKVLLISAAAVVVVAVAGVVVYLLVRGDSSEAASGPGVPTISGSGQPPSPVQSPSAGSTPASVPGTASAVPRTPADDAGAAQAVAEQVASAISNADVATLSQLSCDPDSTGAEDTFPPDAKVDVIGEPQVSGDTASVDVRVTLPGADPATVPMPLTKQDGRWCIP